MTLTCSFLFYNTFKHLFNRLIVNQLFTILFFNAIIILNEKGDDYLFMYRLIRCSEMPKFLKILLYILLTLTCVYWIGYFLYKILEFIRVILHMVSERGHWWFMVFVIIGVAVATLLIAQFAFDLDPIGKFVNWVQTNIQLFRNWVANLVSGN